MSETEDILTTEDVADHVHVSRETVLRAVRRGKLSALRVGRQYRYFRQDVRAWLESLRVLRDG